jgi:magnesium chelatase family protein
MQVYSFSQDDLSPFKIVVELHTRFQVPSFHILGLAGTEIQEARERIVAAFTMSEFEFPKKKVVVNLAPSAVRKAGTGHDLAIAIKILESSLDRNWPEIVYAWGELGLNGEVKNVGKMAALVELLLKENEASTVILNPVDEAEFYAYCEWRAFHSLPNPSQLKIISISALKDLPDLLDRAESTRPAIFKRRKPTLISLLAPTLLPLSENLTRTLLISLAGRHHVILLGPKGIGKSQAIHWYRALIPESSALQTWKRCLYLETRERTDLNAPKNAGPDFSTPVRQVHSQVKPPHLLGSYSSKGFRPGELSLAHGGIFIADEFMEWARDAKEALREPLQAKRYTVTRVLGHAELECDFQFVGTGNLCPCGGLPIYFRSLDPEAAKKTKCKCRPNEVLEYLKKLSGPIADRLDLVQVVTSVPVENLTMRKSEAEVNQLLQELKLKIAEARSFSLLKFKALPSELAVNWLEDSVEKRPKIQELLKRLPNLRSRHKVLRVAHTLQSLEQCEELKEEHVFEAISYRFTDTLAEPA